MEPTKQNSCLSENTFYAVDTIKIFIDEKYVIVSVVKRLKLDEDEIEVGLCHLELLIIRLV